MPKRTNRGTRKKPMGMRKRKRSKKRVTFKTKALRQLPITPKGPKTFYETQINGNETTTPCPGLNIFHLTVLNVASGNMDTRSNSKVLVKGFRFRMHFKNALFRPQVVNVALVNPRNRQNVAGDFSLAMFKRMGLGTSGSTSEEMDFGSPDMQGIHYATAPINTNAYNVVWHSRFKLGVISTTGGYSSGELKNFRSMYRYIKINKLINFPDSTSNLPETSQRFYLLIWAAPMDYQASGGAVADGLSYQAWVQCVFDRQD